jgi:Tol biopolymer transport system component
MRPVPVTSLRQSRPTALLAALSIALSACGVSAPAVAPSTAPSAALSAAPSAAASIRVVATSLAPSPSPTPTIRPGEQWIAYQCWRQCGPGFRIMLVRPDGTGDHWALPSVPGDQLHPDWSPDGMKLTFFDGNAIWTADVDGANARAVYTCQAPCHDIDSPAWSPDGRSIAFNRYDDVDGRAVARIETVDPMTGATRTVLDSPGPAYPFYIRWAPDGRSLVVDLERYLNTLYDTKAETGAAIAVVDLTAKPPTMHRLTDWPLYATYPDWSPTGDRIVFSTFDLGARDGGGVLPDPSQPSDLYTIRPDGSGLTQVTHNPHGSTLVRNGTASGPLSTQPTWAPDGRSIIFVQVDGDTWPGWETSTIRPDGTGFGPAPSSGFHFGTHPRLRPTP